MKYQFDAWAIDTGDGNYIGRYWWFDNKAPQIPMQFLGCKAALFRYRYYAMRHLPSIRAAFPKAKVVHVYINITAKVKDTRAAK